MGNELPPVECDVLLIGAGIMSATVGVLLKELQPSLRVVIVEKLDRVAAESSAAHNNAGTGHAALCELNYTPADDDGNVDIKKARKIMEAFEVSKQLWSYLALRPGFAAPRSFVHSVPHCSFVTGEDDVAFLRRRFVALGDCALFHGMEFSDAPEVLARWMPLMMAGRDGEVPCAATRSTLGTDVDFGALASAIFEYLATHHDTPVRLEHEVYSLRRDDHSHWLARFEREFDDDTGDAPIPRPQIRARFVFIGAGGGALELLDSSDIAEARGYGGFPVGGQWLVCKNATLVEGHFAKVYGKAKSGTPPMSVPHLDTRFFEGKRALIFGPFAGFSTKFTKEGSYLDLMKSITGENVLSMLSAGLRNVPLTRYLIQQVTMSFEDKIDELRAFLPSADPADWELGIAGQRVQVIKRDVDGGGTLEFGTEIISCHDNTIAALLGASPGASTAVSIAIELLIDCFPEQMASAAWQQKLREMIPSYGKPLADDPALAQKIRALTHQTLGLEPALLF